VKLAAAVAVAAVAVGFAIPLSLWLPAIVIVVVVVLLKHKYEKKEAKATDDLVKKPPLPSVLSSLAISGLKYKDTHAQTHTSRRVPSCGCCC
jgi:UDP-N-acetylmuramyl pentapeptide phosphotransferase/UDP-N-acetylglucosamine-1-phosphate transferase